METQKPKKAQPKKPRKSRAKKKVQWSSKKIVLLCVVILLLFSGGGYFLYQQHTYESTDDAMVQAHTTMLAPKVNGLVTEVLVDEHQAVRAGQLLARLEQRDYRAALESAVANLQSVRVQSENAQRDYTRAVQLYRDHAITHQTFDHARASRDESSA